MPSKLCKWGNSLGLRVPNFIAVRAGLVAGDHLYINLMDNGEIVIRPVKARDIPAGYKCSGNDATQRTKAAPLTENGSLPEW